MSKKTKREKEYDMKFDLSNACSATDCTGLIQSGPVTEDDFDVYKEIYHFGVPEVTEAKAAEKGKRPF